MASSSSRVATVATLLVTDRRGALDVGVEYPDDLDADRPDRGDVRGLEDVRARGDHDDPRVTGLLAVA